MIKSGWNFKGKKNPPQKKFSWDQCHLPSFQPDSYV